MPMGGPGGDLLNDIIQFKIDRGFPPDIVRMVCDLAERPGFNGDVSVWIDEMLGEAMATPDRPTNLDRLRSKLRRAEAMLDRQG